MKNSADQGGCYPQRPKAEVDEGTRANLQVNKRTLNWQSFWNKVYCKPLTGKKKSFLIV